LIQVAAKTAGADVLIFVKSMIYIQGQLDLFPGRQGHHPYS